MQALSLISAPWQRDAKNPIYQLKSINYLEAILARRHAEAANVDDILFFNNQNHATETSVANLFIIKNNCLFTPSLASGVLAGVMRERLLLLCKQQGIPCSEIELPRTRLINADAIFICNALQGIQTISNFENHHFKLHHALLDNLRSLLAQDYLEE